jgi:alpha-N-arabinofuranosidase
MSKRTYRNPVIPGFYPDPSVCRVGEDFYLITSTFEYFPGVPIFHSRDLVHWRQLGHVLDRPSQLDLDHVEPSDGIFAPTIRHHDGTFYMVTTLRDTPPSLRGADPGFRDRNFVVTSDDPAGDWSEPTVLVERPGIIDPSLFFDDDGRAWYMANERVADPPYADFRQIWLQELDLENMALIGERYELWSGALYEASCPEAPHIYKIDGMYYLMVAEGGTYYHHATTIARSASVTGPYTGNPGNPILTHRHLGLDYPISNIGHADLVETQNGEWWMVALASRPYGGYYYNLGRETVLAPVRWENGWPLVSPGKGRVELEHEAPDLPETPWPAAADRDDFETDSLGDEWNFVRTPRESFWSLTERQSHLRLQLRNERLSGSGNPSYVCRRQQHINFRATAAMDFSPASAAECAGLAVQQNRNFHFLFVVTATAEGQQVMVIRCDDGELSTVATRPAPGDSHVLTVEATGQEYSFHYGTAQDRMAPVAEKADGRILSTQLAGGFTGAYIGLYGSSNGEVSDTVVDFDWFDYSGT